MVKTMARIAFATIENDGTITLEFDTNDNYVHAVYDDTDECLECDGTFTDIDNACDTMEKLYRANEWNFTRI